MNIWLWMTLLIFLAYFALAYTANKTGWLERHSTSLVVGLILMWRTQRGKELIERISGRSLKANPISNRVEELEGEILKTRIEIEETEGGEGAARGDGADMGEDAEKVDGEGGPSREVASGDASSRESLEEKMRGLERELALAREELGEFRERPENRRTERKADLRLKFWRGYGNVAIGIVLFFMFLMFALLVWQSFIVVRIPPGLIQPQQMLGLPGVNPVIPLWYGIFGLAVAMFVHELAHGIVARVGKIKVKSLGLLFLVVPIGAFVEPDEEQLSRVDRARRARVFAVGPATNILVAFLVLMVFSWGFMASLEQSHEGAVVNHIVEYDYLTIDNETVKREPPASAVGLKPWSIIVSIESVDGEPIGEDGSNLSRIRNRQDFTDTLDRTQAGQTVNIVWYYDGELHNGSVKLWDKGWRYDDAQSAGKGYLGVGSLVIRDVPAAEYPDAMAHPMDYADDAMSFRNITFFYISLPFASLQPAPEGVMSAFEVTGPLSVLGETGFWIVANLLYWIFWLNIMVGIFNALPAIPLDGGYIFRDGLSWLLERLLPSKDRGAVDALATKVTIALSVIILFLILWQFIGPSVGAAVGL